jgi:cytochrome P450
LLGAFLRASEVRHRAAGEIVAALGPPRAGSGCPTRTAVIETLVNSYNGLAIALAWILVELSRRPAVDRAVRSELAAAAADPALITAATAPFTNQVVLECLRLHPVAWAIARVARRTDELAGRRVPSGARVVCCIAALHRNETVWDKPDVFDPQRFAHDASLRRHRRAYLPFGLGPQACPAGRLAPLMLLTVLRTLLQRYDLTIARPRTIGQRTLVSLLPDPDSTISIRRRAA